MKHVCNLFAHVTPLSSPTGETFVSSGREALAVGVKPKPVVFAPENRPFPPNHPSVAKRFPSVCEMFWTEVGKPFERSEGSSLEAVLILGRCHVFVRFLVGQQLLFDISMCVRNESYIHQQPHQKSLAGSL